MTLSLLFLPKDPGNPKLYPMRFQSSLEPNTAATVGWLTPSNLGSRHSASAQVRLPNVMHRSDDTSLHAHGNLLKYALTSSIFLSLSKPVQVRTIRVVPKYECQ
eukprot:3506574-Amphidinium_carterae.1